jgi:hypothetical protein
MTWLAAGMGMRILERANAGDFLFLFRLHFTHSTNHKMLSRQLYDWLKGCTGMKNRMQLDERCSSERQ